MKRLMVSGLLVLMALAGPVWGQKSIIVSIKTTDGVQLVADFYPAVVEKAPAVILLHMYRSRRSAWDPLVPKLHEAGFAVLAIDMRGHGESVEPSSMELVKRVAERDASLFNSMYWDVEASYSFLSGEKGVDMTRVGIVGASVGTSVAIKAASKNPAIDAVVCMTAGENYLGINSVDHIQECREQPVLLMSTEQERKATDKLATLNRWATKKIYPGGQAHGTRMFGKMKGVEDEIIAFLKTHLGGPATSPVVARWGKDVYFPAGGEVHRAMRPDRAWWFSSADEATNRGLKAGGN